MNPDIVTAIGLMLFFITFNIEKGLITLLIAHIAFVFLMLFYLLCLKFVH